MKYYADPWEVVSNDIFMVNKEKPFVCCRLLQQITNGEEGGHFAMDDLVQTAKWYLLSMHSLKGLIQM